ncbi:MAG: alpha/beta hydrolase [Synergistaceae bacterium]|jgi:fermentation-respiration switch protein FrsA (DUF1100 family)|nr:alpha/beta hydrolase [Synergistaceae bacterium]
MKDKTKKKTSLRPLLLFLLLVFLAVGMRFALPRVVFRPTKTLSLTPAGADMPYEDVTLTTPDDVRLHGWYVPADNARATLLFFHGNAGNLSHRVESIEIFHDLGLSVFIIDYRGYGQSGGEPSIPGVTLDALTAWRWLTEEKGVPAEKIIVFGRSMGGAAAMELMRQAQPGALILESTFSSLPEMFPIPLLAPVACLVIGDVWNSAEAAATLTVPTLCIHSPNDEVVPFRLGKRLCDAVASEKTFVEIHGGHNEGFLDSIDIYRPALDAFLTKRFGAMRAGKTDF